jgi:DNA-binding response OmpR family regulator
MPSPVISIIDDDPSVREGTMDLLNSAGFVAETFKDADEFLKSGRVDDASCVVADMRMPGMSGLELHDHLLRVGKTIPTILITAFPRNGDRARALESGVSCYLSKPFNDKDLLSYVRSALSSRRECHDAPRTLSRYTNGAVYSSGGRSGHRETSGSIDAAQTLYDTTLHIEELNGPNALEQITPEWELLDAQISPRTPFTSPLWAKLWWRQLRQTRPAIRQEFFAHVVRDQAGRLLAIVPMLITHRPGYGPLRLRLLQFFGAADGSITEHRCIICREDDERRVIQALVGYLCARKDEWDLFAWTGIRHDEIARDRPGNPLKVYKKMPDYFVPLPDSWEKLRSGLSANMKEAIRKCYKNLARDGHAFAFRAVTSPGDIPAALDRLLALHSERAQFKYATRHRDLFAQGPHRAFIADLARLTAERDEVRIFELEVDGKVVASRMAFLLGDELYLYYSGYDLAWRKHSIMTTLMCECFKWAIEHGVKVVNLSKGKDPSKLRWRGREIMFHDALLMSPTRRGRLISRAYDLVSRQPDLFVRLTELLTVVGGVVKLMRLEAVSFW